MSEKITGWIARDGNGLYTFYEGDGMPTWNEKQNWFHRAVPRLNWILGYEPNLGFALKRRELKAVRVNFHPEGPAIQKQR